MAARADNVTLVSVGGATSTSGSVYIVPYTLNDTGVDGGAINIQVICDSFGNEVSIGETWQGTTNIFGPSGAISGGIFGNSPADVANYDEAVILYAMYLSGTAPLATANATQFAVWGLFTPSVVGTADWNSSGAAALLASYGGSAGFNFTDYDLITPIAGTESGNLGTAQEFIYQDADVPLTPADTPEPASIALFGSGMLGVGFSLRRKLSRLGAL